MTKSKIHPKASQNIDAYLLEVKKDRRLILELVRKTVNDTDKRIAEDWKWGAPCFNLDGLICWFVGFKTHVGLNFFKGSLIKDTFDVFEKEKSDDKGNRMIHYHTIKSVDIKVLKDYVKQAILLNEQNINVETTKKRVIMIPDYFLKALEGNITARSVFEKFTDAQKMDYVEWLVDATREETREKRISQSVAWIAEGKTRNT